MSRSTPDGHSAPKSHSRDRTAAVAAIIDSLQIPNSLTSDAQNQVSEPILPNIGTDSGPGSSQPVTPVVTPPQSIPDPEPPPPPPPALITENEPPSPPRLEAEPPPPPPPPPPSAVFEPAPESRTDGPPPPPPTAQAEPENKLPPKSKADFASSSAMVKDILSADPHQGSDEGATPKPGSDQHSAPTDQPADASVSSDFFTSAKPKRRRWRLK